eukprot:2972567-Lingulodinium_polyedra.AAC.1
MARARVARGLRHRDGAGAVRGRGLSVQRTGRSGRQGWQGQGAHPAARGRKVPGDGDRGLAR